MNTSTIKQCTKCSEFLPYTDFYKSVNGYTSACKSCTIYANGLYRANRRAGKYRSQRPLFLINRERLALGGAYRARYTTDHRPCTIEFAPYGYIVDGTLCYGTYDIEDVLLYIHDKKIKVLEKTDVNTVAVETYKYNAVRNSCGDPLGCETLVGLVSLDQYYLWMESPRPFTPEEVAHHLKLPLQTVQFILAQENRKESVKSPHSPGAKNSERDTPQHIDITFVEE